MLWSSRLDGPEGLHGLIVIMSCPNLEKKKKTKEENKQTQTNIKKNEAPHQESPRRDLNTGCETNKYI